MATYDDLPYIVVERRTGGVAPFLWGALVGAGVALLYAPRSGTAARREITAGFGRLRRTAEHRVDEARDAVTDAAERTRERMHEQVSSLRQSFDEQADEARDAMDVGRREATRARQDLEARVAAAKAAAEDPDRVEADVVVTGVAAEDEPEDQRIR